MHGLRDAFFAAAVELAESDFVEQALVQVALDRLVVDSARKAAVGKQLGRLAVAAPRAHVLLTQSRTRIDGDLLAEASAGALLLLANGGPILLTHADALSRTMAFRALSSVLAGECMTADPFECSCNSLTMRLIALPQPKRLLAFNT